MSALPCGCEGRHLCVGHQYAADEREAIAADLETWAQQPGTHPRARAVMEMVAMSIRRNSHATGKR